MHSKLQAKLRICEKVFQLHKQYCTKVSKLCSQQTFVLVKTYWRRLENVFSVTIFCLPRRLEDIIARRLANTSWRRLEDVLEDEKCYAEDVFKTSCRTRNVCWVVTIITRYFHFFLIICYQMWFWLSHRYFFSRVSYFFPLTIPTKGTPSDT